MFRLTIISFCLVVYCGASTFVPKPRLDGRIVGGEIIAIDDAPFQVSLQTGSGGHFCGGSMIDPNWVLTAAHCVKGGSPNQVRVNSADKTKGGEVLKVLKVIAHEKYNGNTIDYDYALLKVEQTKTVTKFATLIEQNGVVEDGTSLTVSGWGNTQVHNPSPNLLRSVKVDKTNDAVCNSAYSGGITDRMICAGFKEGGKDACQGDSGGPIFINNKEQTLIGIVSWGYGCAQPDYPGVYARISAARDWIDSKMN